MKRVFAFISLFAIALVMFGFGTSNVKAADQPAAGKWFENPYLLTDDEGNVVEIPMYIMNSIKTTFPDYFDYEGAKGTEFEDKNWGGTVRQYAWNGVKVIIPQFNAEGATGKYYGIYPQGAHKGGEIGIGGMIYTTSGTYDQGTFYKGGSYVRVDPQDPSLSFYLFNDQEADWSMVEIIKAQVANPYIIFDGEGKAVAGLVLPDTGAGVVEAAYGLGQEFCYDENGVGVVANADASNCAKVMVDGEEDDLDKPILDEEGNPTGEYEKVQVPGDDPNYIAHRYVWQYMEEKPANLNNGYLNEGWRADNWDFYNEETKVAVMLLGSYFANGGQVSAAELAADETIEAGHVRAPFNSPVIPAGGLLYKFGYLERTSTLLPLFKEVQAQAYLYGRDEAYSQTVKCYNYAASDISFIAQAVNNYGLNLIEGTNTIELVKGESVVLNQLIDLTGVAYCFTDESDPFSFASSILTDEQAEGKLKEFIEAEKALLREEVAYEAYQKWLDEMAAEEAKLISDKDNAAAAYVAAKAAKEALEAAAEAEILALTKEEEQATVNEYKALVKAVEDAAKAIEAKKGDIVKKEAALELAKKEYATATVSYKDTLQYKGYNTSLSDAKAAHDAALAVVSSYIALGLGNKNIKTSDILAVAEQDSKYENWTITYYREDDPNTAQTNESVNAGNEKAKAIQDALEAFIAAIGTADEATAKEALKAEFNVDANSEFAKDYELVVSKYVDTLVNLNIANIAMSDYIAECLAKTADKKAAMEAADAALKAAIAELGVPYVDANENGKEDLEEQGTATGLYLVKDQKEAARLKFIAEYLNANPDYVKAVTAYNEALAAYLAATTTLGNPTADLNGDGDTKDEGEQATGWYVAYETTVKEVEANITAEAKVRAQKVYDKWYEEEYSQNIALDFVVVENGIKVVYKSEYETKADIAKAFLADWQAWAENDEDDYEVVNYTANDLKDDAGEPIIVYGWPEFLKASVDYYTSGSDYDETKFWSKDMIAKWSWLLEYITIFSDNAGNINAVTQLLKAANTSGSTPIRVAMEVFAFLNDTSWATWKAANAEAAAFVSTGWLPGSADYSDAKGQQWKPKTWNYDDPITPDVDETYKVIAHELVNGKKVLEITAYSPILDKSSTLELTFVTIADEYDATPIIEVNSDKLYVTDPKAFNLRSIANAYDRVYSEATGLKGNDISEQINFVCPELDAALASGVISGEFPVEMTVVNAYGRKVVTETAVVKFVDTVAPVLQARDVTLNYGEDFHFLDGIYFAYDNVEGNLFEADYFAFVAEQDTVNTLKPGEYTVKVSAMDKSGNSREVEYVVVVNEQEVNVDEIIDAIEDVNSAVEDTQASLGDVKEDTEEIKDNQAGIAGDAADAKDAAENNSLVVVATVLAGVAALASVGAVVLVVLKRK